MYMDLGLSGLASGLDWRSLVDQLAEVERLPQHRLLQEQDQLEQRRNAYGSILTQLKVLQNRVAALESPALYDARSATSSDPAVSTVSAAAGAVRGTFTFEFQQLAASARQIGSLNAGRALSPTADVSGVTLANAGFTVGVTPGTFRINGAEVNVSAGDTLAQVFDRIHAATQGAVTASYDPDTDRIRLASSGEIVLGSATDSSNFLQAARLFNNGTGSVESTASLGGVRVTASLDKANLATDIAFGESGTGLFRINGVEIRYGPEDTVESVLKRIHDSSAGVSASYDAQTDRFVLTNKATGDVGIALEDVEGNFLAATGLTSGSLQHGRDLLYTIDGGPVLRSASNTITEVSSGLAGVTVTALKGESSTVVSVDSSTSGVRDAITGFIDAYNKAQSLIASQTATSTAADGKVSTSLLSSDSTADSIGSTLRRLVYSAVDGLDLRHLESLGIKSNSNDDTLTLEDPSKLDAALASRMSDVRNLLTNESNGIVVRLKEYLEQTAGEDGVLSARQDLFTRQAASIDVQVADLERVVQANRQRMIDSFVAMETAQQNINQQLQFLQQRFGSTSP